MKNIQSISKEGRLANNMIFLCCDIIETLSNVAESEAYKAGFKWDAQTKSSLLRIKYAAKDMRKRTTETGMDSQLDFGEDAENILKLILLAVDRTGNDNKVMHLIHNFAESFQSKLNLNLKKFGI